MRTGVVIAGIVVTLASLCGCSIPRSVVEGGPTPGQHVVSHTGVLVLRVPDGHERGEDPSHGSGEEMVSALSHQLELHGTPFSTTDTTSLSDGFAEAQREGFGYVCKGTIVLWEDNATAWSGNGDKLALLVQLYDARTHALIASATHRRVATGFTVAPGSPDRFTEQVAAGALGKIYGWQSK